MRRVPQPQTLVLPGPDDPNRHLPSPSSADTGAAAGGGVVEARDEALAALGMARSRPQDAGVLQQGRERRLDEVRGGELDPVPSRRSIGGVGARVPVRIGVPTGGLHQWRRTQGAKLTLEIPTLEEEAIAKNTTTMIRGFLRVSYSIYSFSFAFSFSFPFPFLFVFVNGVYDRRNERIGLILFLFYSNFFKNNYYRRREETTIS